MSDFILVCDRQDFVGLIRASYRTECWSVLKHSNEKYPPVKNHQTAEYFLEKVRQTSTIEWRSF